MISLPEPLTAACARYAERAGDVRAEQRKLAAADGRKVSDRRRDVAAAEREEALELRLSPEAHQLATRLAAAGNQQAAEALARAQALDPALVFDIGRQRFGRQPHQPGEVNQREAFAPVELRALRRSLVELRAHGCDFGQAWVFARQRVHLGGYADAAEATKKHWRQAYERSSSGAGLSELAGDPGTWQETARHEQVA